MTALSHKARMKRACSCKLDTNRGGWTSAPESAAGLREEKGASEDYNTNIRRHRWHSDLPAGVAVVAWPRIACESS